MTDSSTGKTETFFHSYTALFSKRCKTALILVDIPLFQVCVICIVDMILNYKKLFESNFFMLMCIIIVSSIFLGLVFSLFCIYFTYNAIKRHSRYTYFEIEQKVMIFSKYGGEYYHLNKRTVNRELYIIPFKSFEKIESNPKKKSITIKGEIRFYYMSSDDLGYHIKNGDIDFDHWWLNENNFTLIEEVEISNCFERVKLMETSIDNMYQDFKLIPPPKPFVLENNLYVPKKKNIKVSNRLLSLPSYDRKW